MKIQFLPLFTLRVTHDYYGAGETCPDFDFILAEHSQRALAGARMLARTQGGRLHVLFEADDNNLPVQDINGLELLIGLRLRNACFACFTDPLPEFFPLYANTSMPKGLDMARACDLAAHSFTPKAATAMRPLTINMLRMRDNVLVWGGEIRDGENMPKIDMSSWEAGCHLVTQQFGAESENRLLVIAPDLAEVGVWGIVSILVKPGLWEDLHKDPPSSPEFKVAFQPAKDKLEYYIVAHNWNDNDFNRISVADSALNSAVAFERIDKVDFAAQNAISSRLLGTPDDKVVLFRSTSAVPRRAAPIKHFQLSRNGNTLIKNLPLPRVDMPSARFVIHLSKP